MKFINKEGKEESLTSDNMFDDLAPAFNLLLLLANSAQKMDPIKCSFDIQERVFDQSKWSVQLKSTHAPLLNQALYLDILYELMLRLNPNNARLNKNIFVTNDSGKVITISLIVFINAARQRFANIPRNAAFAKS